MIVWVLFSCIFSQSLFPSFHPCEGIKKNDPISYLAAKECILSTPYEVSEAEGEINYVLDILEHYVFKDIVTDSGPPWNDQIDVFEELRKISMMNYGNDYEFRNAIRKTLAELNDAHLAYLMTSGYYFRFFQPFPIRQRTSGDFEICEHWDPQLLQLDIQKMFSNVYDSDDFPNLYKSAKIKSINGLDPYQAIKDFADNESSYSRDSQIRFNHVLRSGWHSRTLTRVSLPDEFITYSLEMPDGSSETIKVPWVAVSSVNFEHEQQQKDKWGFESERLKKMFLDLISSSSTSTTTKSISHLLDPVFISHLDELFPYVAAEIQELIDEGMNVYEMDRQLGIQMIAENNIKRRRSTSTELLFEEPVPKGYKIVKVTKLKDHGEHRYFRLFQNEENPEIALLKVISFMPNMKEEEEEENKESQQQQQQQQEEEEDEDEEEEEISSRSRRSASLAEYVTQMHNSFKLMNEIGTKKLILDVRGNTGGIVCLSSALLSYLSPYAPLSSGLQEDMVFSDLMNHVYCKDNPFTMAFMVGQDGETIYNTSPDWYRKGFIRKRGKKRSQYSQLYRTNCEMVNQFMFALGNVWDEEEEKNKEEEEEELKWPWNDSERMFEPEDLLVLTDGTCGSTCGTFVTTLQSLKLGKVVNMGGWKNSNSRRRSLANQMNTVSFPGGGVSTEDKFVKLDNSFTTHFCPIPKKEKRIRKPEKGGYLSVTYVESYPVKNNPTAMYEFGLVDDSIPLDFVPFQADFHIESWDFGNDIFSDSSLLSLFDVCVEWEIKRNDDMCKPTFENSVYGNPCGKNGKFLEDQCVLRGCEKGFYLSVSEDECIQMPEVNAWGWINVVLGNTVFQLFILRLFAAYVLAPFCILCCCCILFVSFCVGGVLFVMKERKKNYRDDDDDYDQEIDPSSTSSLSSYDNMTTSSSDDLSTTTTSSSSDTDRISSSSSSSSTDLLYLNDQ